MLSVGLKIFKVVQGGDWGQFVSPHMQYPAYHLSDIYRFFR
jgi:hypothetical protein